MTLPASRRPRPQRPTPYTWMTVDYATGEGLDAAVAFDQYIAEQEHRTPPR